MFQIDKYKTDSGECPLDVFIQELIDSGGMQDVAKIDFYIDLLRNLGDEILSNSNWAKNLGDGIFELRPKSNRVLYFYCSSNKVYVLLHGFKRSNKKLQQRKLNEQGMKLLTTRGEKKMENKEFDLFENINLTEENKKYFDEQREVSKYIIKLIKRRIELKMSQRDLAEKTGIKQPMIARIESFDSTPRFDTLLKIANALDLKLEFEKNINININLNVNINVNYKAEEANIFHFNADGITKNVSTVS